MNHVLDEFSILFIFVDFFWSLSTFQSTKLYLEYRRKSFGILSIFTKQQFNTPCKFRTNFHFAYLCLIRNDDKNWGKMELVVEYLGYNMLTLKFRLCVLCCVSNTFIKWTDSLWRSFAVIYTTCWLWVCVLTKWMESTSESFECIAYTRS